MASKKRPLAVLFLACSLLASQALAEPSPADRETARALMDEGKEKLAAGDLQGALKAYQAAHALMNVPTTGLALGKVQAQVGQLVEARVTLFDVGRSQAQPGEPKVFQGARDEATKLAEELAGRIPSLKIEVDAPEGAKVTLDGEVVPPAVFGVARKLNPGRHILQLSAPGHQLARVELTVPERDNQVVKLTPGPRVAAAPASSSAPPPATTAATTARPPASEDKPPRAKSLLEPIGFGVGGAMLVLGAVTGYLSMSKTSSIKVKCSDGVCPKSTENDISSAKTLATVSNVSFALAVVGAGVGFYGMTLNKKADSARRIDVRVGLTGVAVGGAF